MEVRKKIPQQRLCDRFLHNLPRVWLVGRSKLLVGSHWVQHQHLLADVHDELDCISPKRQSQGVVKQPDVIPVVMVGNGSDEFEQTQPRLASEHFLRPSPSHPSLLRLPPYVLMWQGICAVPLLVSAFDTTTFRGRIIVLSSLRYSAGPPFSFLVPTTRFASVGFLHSLIRRSNHAVFVRPISFWFHKESCEQT